jgi:hypothetical protein
MAGDELVQTLIVVRQIWLRRNRFVFENFLLSPSLVLEIVQSTLVAFKEASLSQKKKKKKRKKERERDLCFSDDLLIFSAASLESMSAIKGVFDEFENLSGLRANPSKSSFFVLGFLLMPRGSCWISWACRKVFSRFDTWVFPLFLKG